jgi:hypothetical protein
LPDLAAPGLQFAHTSQVASDGKLGSVLFYPVFTSSATAAGTQNTRINITNADAQRTVSVHLFFVEGATCSVADMYICLTRSQTATFMASEFDPGSTGYLIAVATDSLGCPTAYNALMGDEFVKFASGHQANLPAESAAGLYGLIASPPCDDTTFLTQLKFDGVSYDLLGRSVAISNLPDRASGNDTMLILNGVGGNLGIGISPLPPIFGIVYSDTEVGASFSFTPSTCQLISSLSNSFPRTAPRIETIIPAGRSGWIKIFSFNDVPLFGAVINANSGAGAGPSVFSQGHNLHKLTLSAAGVLTMPVFPIFC